ncbi:hypothetical protein A3C86_03700 [Candidatus Kaiserbacteria bacterium RIFCSPHIGHO2_02_FULL_49_16]|uniref:N-acetyltransferase domain-containing protein n=1 Tax=Candidatus Kaiserbacteria bacterium RIFCSPHIGHO2_02_FULL_49_16 TaxID=1798490 RepID=A0A1F6DB11_9BACT|nr:MAG: hypothetical protein A3C86_03700 [Candidatus Kaiserbacteria bacterium RIFCSPHIGHO2_02_FULL_49_16]
MSPDQLATGETEQLRWEPATDHPNDLREIHGSNRDGSFGGSHYPSENFLRNFYAEGYDHSRLILRKGKQAIGTIALKNMNVKDGRYALQIDSLFVRSKDRSPGIFKEIVRTIRSIAEERKASCISWDPDGAIINRMSDKMNAEKSASRPFRTLPIGKFDVGNLINSQRQWKVLREKNSAPGVTL